MNDVDLNLGESRARILQEANRLFIEQGYHRLSMRQIAESAGLSKAGIYHHFKDKECLFLAVLTEPLEVLEALILQAEQTGGTSREKVAVMVHSILSQSPVQRAVIRLASQEMGQLSQLAQQEFGQRYQQKFIGRIRSLLAAGVQSGEFAPIDPMVLTWALLGLMYPYFYSTHNDYIGADEQTIHHLLDIFFYGIISR